MVTEGASPIGDTQARMLRDGRWATRGNRVARRFKDDGPEVSPAASAASLEKLNDIKAAMSSRPRVERVAATVKGQQKTAMSASRSASADPALARDVHDPGIGFITLTKGGHPDLQLARVYYPLLGDEKRSATRPGARPRPAVPAPAGGPAVRLRRVPELESSSTNGCQQRARTDPEKLKPKRTPPPAPPDETKLQR